MFFCRTATFQSIYSVCYVQFRRDDGDATCWTLADGVPSWSCDATFVMLVHNEQHNVTVSLVVILQQRMN